MMTILAIDTALEACTVALSRNGVVAAALTEIIGVGHAERLAPMAAILLEQAGVAAAEIEGVAVVVGPGTFAGVRVGVAFARGFAAGRPVRLSGVSSLEAIARGAHAAGRVAAVIDARRGSVYAALYERGLQIVAPFVASIDDARARLARAIFVGPGARLLDAAAPAFSAIDPVDILALAAGDPARPATPLYLRPPDAAPARASRFAALLDP
jgi:tRNA threonylcarbamoyladenosine biosynthesis protein TsaB